MMTVMMMMMILTIPREKALNFLQTAAVLGISHIKMTVLQSET